MGTRLLSGMVGVVLFAGCGRSDAEKSKEAILSVLRQDKQFSESLRVMPADASPPQYSQAIEQF